MREPQRGGEATCSGFHGRSARVASEHCAEVVLCAALEKRNARGAAAGVRPLSDERI